LIDFIYFSLTGKCNLNCAFCYASPSCQNTREFSFNEIVEFLRVFSINGGKGVQFTGGEIFLRDDILEILSRAVNFGLQVNIITNGTLLTEKPINFIKNNRIDITVSIDGPQEIHDVFRGMSGAYKKTMDCISEFNKRGIHFSLQTMVFPSQFEKQLVWLEAFAKNSLHKYTRITDVAPEGKGARCNQLLWPYENLKAIPEAANALTRRANYHKIFFTNIISRKEMEYYYPGFENVLKPWIMPDGYIYPFLTHNKNWRLGSINEYPNLCSSVLQRFNDVCRLAYKKALTKQCFSLFNIIAETSREVPESVKT